MRVTQGKAGQSSLPAKAGPGGRVPRFQLRRLQLHRVYRRLHCIRILWSAKQRERKSGGSGSNRIKEKRGVGLGFAYPLRRISQEPLILVSCSEIVPIPKTMRIERQPSLRIRIAQPWNLRLIEVVQIRKRSAPPDHVIQSVLITDACVP